MKIDEILSRLQEQQPEVSNPDELTDRIMASLPDLPTEQPKPARRIKLYFVSAIAAAASVLLLLYLGIGSDNQGDEGNILAAQTDTTIVSPQTGTRQQEKRETKDMADTLKRVKEILHMSKPPKHYMAKQELREESTSEPGLMDDGDIAERTIAEEERRIEMEMMSQMDVNIQADFQVMTKEIRQRGERMNRRVEMAINDDEY